MYELYQLNSFHIQVLGSCFFMGITDGLLIWEDANAFCMNQGYELASLQVSE